MIAKDICHGTFIPAFAPLLFGVMAAVIAFVLWPLRYPGGKTSRVFQIVLVVLAVGVGIYWRSTASGVFFRYELSSNALGLGYFFPTPTVEIPARSLQSIAVVRERSFNRNGESSRWSLRVEADGKIYDSCRTGILDELTAHARSIAAELHQTVEWRQRCLNDAVVPWTERGVTAPGKTTPLSGCTSR